MNRKQRRAASKAKTTIPACPPTAGQAAVDAALANAFSHHQAGRLSDAAVAYRRVLDLAPEHPIALHYLGIVSHQTGKSEDGARLIAEALRLEPANAEAHNNLGIVLRGLGRLDDALASYERALSLKPDYPEAHNNAGNTLRELDRLDAARQHLERAIALKPDYAEALNNLGLALHKLGLFEDAESHLRRAIALVPDYPDGLSNLAVVLDELQRPDEALDLLDRALAINPDHIESNNNRGNILRDMDRFDEALACFETALRLFPGYGDAYVNLGLALQSMGRQDDAVATLRRGLKILPENPDLHWNLALTLLQIGDYAAGWEEYEWRWRMPKFQVFARDMTQPLWHGEELSGRSLHLHAEQGLGDTIQFARYVAMAAAKAARVSVECNAGLRRLFAGSQGWQSVEFVDTPPDGVDFHAPLMSLPRGFATRIETIPGEMPYLAAPPALVDAWAERLAATEGFRLGIVWAGNRTYQNDAKRSLAFPELTPLLETPGCTAFSLQLDRDEAADGVIDLAADLGDFADTAAAIENLDLVIAVDTAVAHLAGALGRPVWTLLPAASDWRWLKNRTDTPWYPSMRLYRQQRPGDWQAVVRAVATDLRQTIAVWPGRITAE